MHNNKCQYKTYCTCIKANFKADEAAFAVFSSSIKGAELLQLRLIPEYASDLAVYAHDVSGVMCVSAPEEARPPEK